MKFWSRQWDRGKDWVDEVHLGVNLNSHRHWKFKTRKASAVFDAVRRLTRLPPEAKRKVIIGEVLPT